MKVYNSYILTVAVLLLLTTVILTAAKLESLGAYYTIYIVEALAATEIYAYFSSKARHGLGLVSMILFGGFMVSLVLEVIRILV